MYIEHEVFIGFRDVSMGNKVTNTALLSYLEDAGGIHSNIAKLGLNDIPETKKSWMILNWRIELYKRPKYADKIIIKTWCSDMDKLYAYRDFEILDENRNVIGKATSKWVLTNIEKKKIVRLDETILENYTIEGNPVFENEKLDKLKEPEEYENMVEFTINRSLIDINNHVHNIYYMDVANEVLPLEIFKNTEFNNINIMYKKEMKLGENVKIYYSKKDNKYTISIKSHDNSLLHAIIVLS